MGADIYTELFGFRKRPFMLLPNPDFLFCSGQHKDINTTIGYRVSAGTGDVFSFSVVKTIHKETGGVPG